MTRRIQRNRDFELSLQINSDQFIPTPRPGQRSWLLNRTIKEFTDELTHLDRVSRSFVTGKDVTSAGLQDRTQKELADHEIMEDWQIPIMQAMATTVTEAGGNILEVGFGRGIASDFIQAAGIKSHTIIECNDSIVERYHRWRARYADRDIRLRHGLWQDEMDQLGQFDGIFFHTYPLNESDFVEQVVQSSTFAEHFFNVASSHLNTGGVFTYLTSERDSLGRGHQRALLQCFTSFSVSRIDGLEIPDDTEDAMWSDSIVIVRAHK